MILKCSGLKNTKHLFSLSVSVGQEVGSNWGRALRVSQKVGRGSSHLQEGCGWAWQLHTHSGLLTWLAGWLELLVGDLGSSPYRPPQRTAWVFSWHSVAFSRVRDPRKWKCHYLLWLNIWDHTPSLLQYSVGHTVHPWLSVRRET